MIRLGTLDTVHPTARKAPAMTRRTVIAVLEFEVDDSSLDLAQAVHARLDEVYPGPDVAAPWRRTVVAAAPDVIAHVLSAADVSLDGGPAEDNVGLLDAAWEVVQHLKTQAGAIAVGHRGPIAKEG